MIWNDFMDPEIKYFLNESKYLVFWDWVNPSPLHLYTGVCNVIFGHVIPN